MLKIYMNITIETLWKQGKSIAEISKTIGHDWKTVNNIVKILEATGKYPIKKERPKILDQYQKNIIEMIEKNLPPLRIFEELTKEVKVSYSATKKYIAEITNKRETCIRFHTQPAEEAQVDFGYVGLTPNQIGKNKKTWVFNMRLSYSRLDYYELVYDQKVETFLQCHVNAFNFFKGIPQYIKIDNLKSAIIDANFYEPTYQILYKQFADYHKFYPLPCRVRKPQEKGKVEAGIKYIKNNFFLGRKFITQIELQEQLQNWLIKANNRIHGTTKKIPQQIFDNEEKNKLLPLPEKDFIIPQISQRKVQIDFHIYVNNNHYSVPFEYVGKYVDIEITKNTIRILYQNQQIAIHPKSNGTGEFITNQSHYPKYKNYLSTDYQEKYQVKMNEIGIYAGQLFSLLLSKHPKDWNRATQGILSLKKDYSTEIINLACKRALSYEITKYKIIRNICQNGLYQLPVLRDSNATEGGEAK